MGRNRRYRNDISEVSHSWLKKEKEEKTSVEKEKWRNKQGERGTEGKVNT